MTPNRHDDDTGRRTSSSGDKNDAGSQADRNDMRGDPAHHRLDSLSAELDATRARRLDADGAQKAAGDVGSASKAYRFLTDLVAGVVVGLALGYGLDRWLGSSPWGVLAGCCLGFGAGLRNILRFAGPQKGSGSSGPSA